MEVSVRDKPMQGSSGLVQLAAAAEAQSSVVQQFVSPPLSLESQLADAQQENSSLTTALRDTSHTLAARQREVEQLRTSSQEVRRHEVKYRNVLDQFSALDRALSGLPGQTVLQRFQALEEELCIVKRDHDVAVGKLSTASHKSSELKTALMQQQGLLFEFVMEVRFQSVYMEHILLHRPSSPDVFHIQPNLITLLPVWGLLAFLVCVPRIGLVSSSNLFLETVLGDTPYWQRMLLVGGGPSRPGRRSNRSEGTPSQIGLLAPSVHLSGGGMP
ncbi:hypothetical protein C8J55DRAFT_558576 [Lentinula edodes]|uniref:Uncharacterized protein n=1 Tax=Lentinula lateritia TaxID=40482 RepID=A0A9W9AR30_9AGAR|nr:hypothetical protein C8J55DRAFT_558576 [Lentinula edodes]